LPGGHRVMRSGYIQQLARFATGALTLLLVQGFCVQRSAWAGCGHLTVSHSDPGQLRSILDTLLDEVAGPLSDKKPLPERSRPCSGAFCSGQPGTPAVPAGAFDRQGDSWAWCANHSGTLPTLYSFDSSGSASADAVIRSSGIFHPPRLLACFS
jgi:hypothetical protein